jgi:hypothetical protein
MARLAAGSTRSRMTQSGHRRTHDIPSSEFTPDPLNCASFSQARYLVLTLGQT